MKMNKLTNNKSILANIVLIATYNFWYRNYGEISTSHLPYYSYICHLFAQLIAKWQMTKVLVGARKVLPLQIVPTDCLVVICVISCWEIGKHI